MVSRPMVLHLTVSETPWLIQLATGVQWGEASKAADHPTAWRRDPTTKNEPTYDVSSAAAEKAWWCTHPHPRGGTGAA